jgi:hypothetical protein
VAGRPRRRRETELRLASTKVLPEEYVAVEKANLQFFGAKLCLLENYGIQIVGNEAIYFTTAYKNPS